MSVRKRKAVERNINQELGRAVQEQITRATEALLAEGANVNSLFEETPVIFLASPPNLELLLTRRAKVDQPMAPTSERNAVYNGMTALAYFCYIHKPNDDPRYYRFDNRMEHIRILLHHQADPNLADKRGKTPLHHLCEASMDPAIIRLLIDHGADVNQVDNESNTPLHALVQYEVNRDRLPSTYEEAIRLLLEAGANPLLKNDDGFTASEIAQEERRPLPVIRLLKQAERNAGANVNVPELPVNAPPNAANAAARGQLRNQILAMGNAQNLANNIPMMNQAEFEHLIANPLRNNENMPAVNHIPHNAGNVHLHNAAPAAGGRRKGKKARKTRKGHKGHKARKARKARKTRRH